ncbi:MAG: ThuA domain-containing protein [Phycisphaerae bacterium]|nr:ThuA domain-containing protein [Phycisphaerae bacterium]
MKALIVYGGWDGHQPEEVSKVFEAALKQKGVEVERSDTLDSFLDAEKLQTLDVIIPQWTMGEISKEQWQGLNEAVRAGVGVAGTHGGMGDSMRSCHGFQWMVGGQFMSHPHVGEYEVYVTETTNPITAALPRRFTYNSEQYYQIVDPGINVLAETLYDYDGHVITMPCIWTKTWGKGRVFYSALGHVAEEFTKYPHVLDMTVRGMLWAAEGKKLA